MDDEGVDVVGGEAFAHLAGVFGFDGAGFPGAGAGGKDLEGVGAGLYCALDSGVATAGGAKVDAYAFAGHLFRVARGCGCRVKV